MAPAQSPFHADTSLLSAVAELASPVPCLADTVVFRQGEECAGLFVLKRGHATLEMECGDAGLCTVFEADDGSLLGLPALISGERYSLTATIAGGSEIGFVQRNSFLGLMNACPRLSLKALQVMAAETRAARKALVEALQRHRLPRWNENGAAPGIVSARS